MPKIFYLVPHSCIIRGLYYQVKACVENNCIHHVWDINLELWVDLILPFIHFVVYFVVGLAFAETRITTKIKQAMAFRRRKLANPDQSYEFRMAQEIEMSQSITIPENTGSINNLDATERAVPDEQLGNPGERLR